MLLRDEIEARLDELRRIRSEGRLSIRYANGREIQYRTDTQLAAAIADLERQLAAYDSAPVTTVLVSASKGLE